MTPLDLAPFRLLGMRLLAVLGVGVAGLITLEALLRPTPGKGIAATLAITLAIILLKLPPTPSHGRWRACLPLRSRLSYCSLRRAGPSRETSSWAPPCYSRC
ncbi:hypothetical protein U1872_02525 [Sphingomonas sp. RB3P16]|uniref:hypothetical protein n=1 Tax=Parasphingomonas frigoris TaxID=3096163 RepID=UPI002FC8A60A